MEQLTNEKYLNLVKKDGWVWATRNKLEDLQKPRCNAVVIAAAIKQDNEMKLVLTSEFRIPLGQLEYGFPAGLVDEGETIEEAVVRELKEETGLTVTQIYHISPLLASSAGLTDECIKIVYCTAEGVPTNEGNVGGENINIHVLSKAEIQDLIGQDIIFGAKCWPVLQHFID